MKFHPYRDFTKIIASTDSSLFLQCKYCGRIKVISSGLCGNCGRFSSNLLPSPSQSFIEKYVSEYLKDSRRFTFSTNIADAISNDIIFVVVATPSTEDHKYDHGQIENIIQQIISFGKQPKRKDIIINCTTFPGYCDTLHSKLVEYNYHISYNPEFIAQGSIIKDQVSCDNVLIGQADEYAGNLIQAIYENMVESKPLYNKMSRTEAELTKLSVNCFLTTKISYANMIGDIAERLGCNADKVLQAVGTDSRIGNKYIKPGFGFGGPCFPRDNRALAKCGEEVGIDAIISKATDEMNKKHLEYQIEDFVKKHPNKNQVIEIEYVTYKKDSVLLEESQQLKFAVKLKELGYNIKMLDTRKEVVKQLKNLL
jgi:nucleotide sugar dehydrogenase